LFYMDPDTHISYLLVLLRLPPPPAQKITQKKKHTPKKQGNSHFDLFLRRRKYCGKLESVDV